MKEAWFRGAKTKEERDKIKRDIDTATLGFRHLDAILERLIKEIPAADYDNAGWAYKQADINGWNRALKQVRELIKEP